MCSSFNRMWHMIDLFPHFLFFPCFIFTVFFSDLYFFIAGPVVTQLSPLQADILGGTVLTFTGGRFVNGSTTVTVGPHSCLAVQVFANGTQMTCVAPTVNTTLFTIDDALPVTVSVFSVFKATAPSTVTYVDYYVPALPVLALSLFSCNQTQAGVAPPDVSPSVDLLFSVAVNNPDPRYPVQEIIVTGGANETRLNVSFSSTSPVPIVIPSYALAQIAAPTTIRIAGVIAKFGQGPWANGSSLCSYYIPPLVTAVDPFIVDERFGTNDLRAI